MKVLTISEEARSHLISMLDKAGLPAVVLGLKEQGCNGYSYTWTPVADAFGEIISLDESHSLVYNKSIVPHIIDSEVQMEKLGFNSRLVLNNPNVAYSCGCGESVNFKNG
jgi:Fe-S cluster assembly iron-binding protein IscA